MVRELQAHWVRVELGATATDAPPPDPDDGVELVVDWSAYRASLSFYGLA